MFRVHGEKGEKEALSVCGEVSGTTLLGFKTVCRSLALGHNEMQILGGSRQHEGLILHHCAVVRHLKLKRPALGHEFFGQHQHRGTRLLIDDGRAKLLVGAW